jgi:hypothetical protein
MAANRLLGCYRRGDANDPEMYVAAIVAVLCRYPIEIIRKATDPVTGISSTEKFAAFMPNSGELKIYCDGLMRPIIEERARHHLLQQLADRREDRSQRLSFDELKEKYGDWSTARQARDRPSARAALIAQIGKDAFDALPDAPDAPR